jgi:hypothetical protein
MVVEIVICNSELCRNPHLRIEPKTVEDLLILVRFERVERFLIAAECFEREREKAFEVGEIVRLMTSALELCAKRRLGLARETFSEVAADREKDPPQALVAAEPKGGD